MAINGIDITYRQVSEGSSGGGIQRSNSKTSINNVFGKGAKSQIPSIMQTSTSSKMALGLKMGAVATVAKIGLDVVAKGVEILTQVYVAKTGEVMKANNLRAEMRALTDFKGVMKQALWQNGYLRNLELARENQALQNERDLSGKIILQKQYQKSLL